MVYHKYCRNPHMHPGRMGMKLKTPSHDSDHEIIAFFT